MRQIKLSHLKIYDSHIDESYVRLIEMHVDGVLIDSMYSIQFWRDVVLYGIEEAFLLLKNQDSDVRKEEGLTELKVVIDGVCAKIRARTDIDWKQRSYFV